MMGGSNSNNGTTIMGIRAYMLANTVYGRDKLSFHNFTSDTLSFGMSKTPSDYDVTVAALPATAKNAHKFWDAHDTVQQKCNDEKVKLLLRESLASFRPDQPPAQDTR